MGLLHKVKTLLKPAKTDPLQTEEAGVVATGRVLDDHPSNKISPKKLKGILDDAENGDIQAQAQLFMDIEEQDSTIAANILTRKRATLTLDWTINAPRNATPQEEQWVDAVRELFEQLGYLDDLVMDCMDAVGHGFSAVEIGWQLKNNQWLPVQFKHCPPSWFLLDKHDRLLLKTPQNPMGEELIPNKWIVHIHRNRSTQLARNGLYRTLAWLYMFKHYSVFDFAEFLELYGFPIRIGKYGAGATKEEKQSLMRALADIGHNAAGIMPESMQVEIKEVAAKASAGQNPYLQMVDWCEKSIARLILGQTLTSGADGKSSTNALGNVHNEVRRDLLVSDAKQLAQTLTQQLILPFLQFNFANVDPSRIPRFEFDTKEPADIKTFAEALPALVDIGMPIPQAWALDKLGIPEVTEDEPILKRLQSGIKPAALSALPQKHGKGCQCGCQAVGLSADFTNAKSEQEKLDASLNVALQQPDFNAQLDPIVQKAVAVLSACSSYEEADEKLAELYPELQAEEHHRYLANALFLSELLGAASYAND